MTVTTSASAVFAPTRFGGRSEGLSGKVMRPNAWKDVSVLRFLRDCAMCEALLY